jgi:integrase
VTILEWWTRWTTDPLFARPKDSTMMLYAERTRPFAQAHADLPIAHAGEHVAARWLAGGKRNGQVPSLRVMFNDAASAKAGRLLPRERNPFAHLGISKGAGRRDQTPPSEEMIWTIIGHAREVTSPDFAAWLQVAAFTGLRPGEMDALEVSSVDFAGDRLHVLEQYNSKTKQFTLPKNGWTREAPLTKPAAEALRSLPLGSREPIEIDKRLHRFCFLNLRDGHWTASGRAYHWNATKAAAGWAHSLYLATRHFAGWYMVNILGMPSEDVAIALGHRDGGDLVRKLYGHRDERQALDRVVAAYGQIAQVRPLRRSGRAS